MLSNQLAGGSFVWDGKMNSIESEVEKHLGYISPFITYWAEPIIQTVKRGRKNIDRELLLVVWQKDNE